jgi:hypothetical protein
MPKPGKKATPPRPKMEKAARPRRRARVKRWRRISETSMRKVTVVPASPSATTRVSTRVTGPKA